MKQGVRQLASWSGQGDPVVPSVKSKNTLVYLASSGFDKESQAYQSRCVANIIMTALAQHKDLSDRNFNLLW